MSKNVLLDNVTHKDLKIISSSGLKFGGNTRSAMVVVGEYGQLATSYPILFQKNPSTGMFESVVLLGFEKDENLFASDVDWNEPYTPLSIERLPFSVGENIDPRTGESAPVVHIDMEHPRVSFSEGSSVFMAGGGNSEYLERINGILADLMEGVRRTSQILQFLTSKNLIEPFSADIKFKNHPPVKIAGFYTINTESLNSLSGEELIEMRDSGLLEICYLVQLSLSNISKMIKLKDSCIKR